MALVWDRRVVKPVLLIRGDNNESDEIALSKLGIPAIIDPYLEINVASDHSGGLHLLELLESADAPLWLIATSVNSLKFWGSIVGQDRLRKAISVQKHVQFAAVGETTAEALREYGAGNVLIPKEATAKSLADELVAAFPVGHALIPGGNLAMRTLPTTLTSAGWEVSTAVVYITSRVEEEPKSAQMVRENQVGAILFRSPSAVRALTHFVSQPSVPLVCAGVTTAEAVEQQGLTVAALSPSPSAEVVASTIYSLLS